MDPPTVRERCPSAALLVEHVRGELSAERSASVGAHLSSCASCARAAAVVSATSAPDEPRASLEPPTIRLPSEPTSRATEGPELELGATLGRYRVGKLLGRGGMGAVYEAFDPELRRRVALKVLRAGLGDDARARMLREAQALARLRHPNVVAIHDVGSSERGEIFLAMELAQRGTLKGYLRAAERTREEVLRAFLQAGRGLEAAHRSGLVHRDFKPDNVLLGDAGLFQVTDFGLARADRDAEPAPASAPASRARGGLLAAELTEEGAVLGTPAYMALEQHLGEETDARTDQFSFGVALFEGLHGHKPYRGEHLLEVLEALQGWRIDWSSPRFRVPRALRAVLRRTLAPQRGARFPTLGPVLDALERSLQPRGRALAVALAVTTSVLGVATAGAVVATRRPAALPTVDACASGKERAAAALHGPLRAKVREVFERFGVDAPDRATARIDAWASDYGEAFRGQCSALLEARDLAGATRVASCFERRLTTATALLELLGQADLAMYASLPEGLDALGQVSECADPGLIAQEDQIARASDPGARRLVAATARSYPAIALGRAEAARQALDEALAGAPEAPAALRAEALYALGSAKTKLSQRDGARAALQASAELAGGGVAPLVEAVALTEWAGILAATDPAAAHSKLDAAARCLEPRRGAKGALATVLAFQSTLYRESGDLARARGPAVRAQALLDGSEPYTSYFVMSALATLEDASGDTAAALRAFEAVSKLWDSTFGSSHPRSLEERARYAHALIRAGNVEEGAALAESTLLAQERVLGRDDLGLVPTLRTLILLRSGAERWADGLALAERAVSILELHAGAPARLGALVDLESDLRSALLQSAAGFALRAKLPGKAEALALRAVAACDLAEPAARSACKWHARVVLGVALLDLGRLAEADQTLAACRGALPEGASDDDRTFLELQHARTLLGLGKRADAIATARAALGRTEIEGAQAELRALLERLGAAPPARR